MTVRISLRWRKSTLQINQFDVSSNFPLSHTIASFQSSPIISHTINTWRGMHWENHTTLCHATLLPRSRIVDQTEPTENGTSIPYSFIHASVSCFSWLKIGHEIPTSWLYFSTRNVGHFHCEFSVISATLDWRLKPARWIWRLDKKTENGSIFHQESYHAEIPLPSPNKDTIWGLKMSHSCNNLRHPQLASLRIRTSQKLHLSNRYSWIHLTHKKIFPS